jgi:hypothetical protein
MPTFANQITYTTWSETLRTNLEHTTTLDRPYALTTIGAERLVRKTVPGAKVVRVESPIYG